MTLEQFIDLDIQQSGRSFYSLDDVIELAQRWRAEKQAAAATFDGWRTDAEVDALLGITREADVATR